MRTQTVMESSNVVVDDLKDFSEYSNEYEIDRFITETSQTDSPSVEKDEVVSPVTESVTTEAESVSTTS